MKRRKPRCQTYGYADIAIGFSGGLVSYCMLLDVMRKHRHVVAVYVDWEQPSSRKERRVVSALKKRRDYVVKDIFEMLRCEAPESRVDFRIVKYNFGGAYGQFWKGRNKLIATACSRYSTNVLIGECHRPHNLVPTDAMWWRFEEISSMLTAHRGESVKVDKFGWDRDAFFYIMHEFGRGFVTREVCNLLSFCESASKIDCGNCYGCFKKWKFYDNLLFNDDLKFERNPSEADRADYYTNKMENV